MQINHDESTADVLAADLPPLPSGPNLIDVERHKDQILQEELDHLIPTANVDLDDLKNAGLDEGAPADQGPSRRFIAKATGFDEVDEPSMGGTLNATTEQAEEDSRAAIEDERNHVILNHNAPPASVSPEPILPPPPLVAPSIEPLEEPVAEPLMDTIPVPDPEEILPPAPEPEPEPTPEPEIVPAPALAAPLPSVEEALATLGYPAGSHPTLADLDQRTSHTQAVPEVDDARAAVASALDNVFNPANNPAESVGSQPLGGELHDDPSAVSPFAAPTVAPLSAPAPAAPAQPVSTAIDLPPLPPLPPLPGQAGGLPPLPPLPDVSELDAHSSDNPPQPSGESEPDENDWQSHTVDPPASNDPGQFHIPGQQ